MQTQNRVKKYFLVSFLVLMILSVFVPSVSRAISAKEQERCNQLKKDLEIQSGTLDPNRQSEILKAGNLAEGLPDFCTAENLLLKVINAAIIIAGSVAVLFLIVGGFWYLTSAGNEEQAEKGKKTAVNAILGLVVIIMSFAIIKIIVSLLTGGSSVSNTVNNTNQNTNQAANPTGVKDPPNTQATVQGWAKEGTDFTFTSMACGAYNEGNTIYYKDFALVMDYYGSETAHLQVNLTDNKGLDYTYTHDNLEEPLVIDGSKKKTVLLNVAGNAFPSNDSAYEYHPEITVHITSDKPVHVLHPNQFYTEGSGATVADATENAWLKFGFLPPSIEIGSTEYTAYAIFWRNMQAFPNGWDTEFSLRNTTSQPMQISMKYVPDYFKKYDSNCRLLSSQTVDHMDIALPPNGSYNVTLSKYLNLTHGDVATTEGAVAFEFPSGISPSLAGITEKVGPLTGGEKCGSG